MRQSLRLVITCILILSCILSGMGIVAAAPVSQSGIAITARGGFGDDGSYLIGEWFPVKVTLSNPAGSGSRRVRIEVDSQGDSANAVTGSYVREIDLPAPSRKELTLYASAGNFARSVDVRLMEGNTQIGRATAKLEPLEQANSIIIGVVSDDPSALNFLKNERFGHSQNMLAPPGYSGYLPPVPTLAPLTPGGQGVMASSPARATIAHMALTDIPTLPWALNSLGALVLDGAETGSLQAEQQKALADWVTRGGTLIAAVRPGGEGSLVGLGDAFPVGINGTRSISGVEQLGEWVAAQPPAGSSQTLVPVATLKPGLSSVRVPVMQNGVPLIVTREVGAGQMVYLALSPGAPPLKNWDGTLALFRRLLIEHLIHYSDSFAGPGYSSYYPNKVFQTYGTVFDLPGLDLPSPVLIGMFLLVYIAVVGPVNFMILRRMRRTELAWLTIPALVLLFSIIAYGIAFQSKGGDLIALRTNITHTQEGLKRAASSQYFGLFSPTRGTYRLRTPADAVVTEINSYGYGGTNPTNPLQLSGDNGTTVNNIKVNTWSLRSFAAETSVDTESLIEADLHIGDDIIAGTIRNRSNQGLQDVALIRGDVVQHINYIAPGQRAEVKMRLSSRPFSYTSPTSLIALPPGVFDPTSQGNPGYNPSPASASDAQRAYNRKVEALNIALRPLLSADAPANLDVLALAWGPPPPTALSVEGGQARYDDLNLWTTKLAVTVTDGGSQSKLSASSVPYTIYAPGNSLDWTTGPPLPPGPITLKPYADIRFQLPAGIVPRTLVLTYGVSQQLTGDIGIMGFEAKSGQWKEFGPFAPTATGTGTRQEGSLLIPGPANYTGPAGDVNIRLLAKSGEQTINLTTLGMSLNSSP